jgi:hypothetical protein
MSCNSNVNSRGKIIYSKGGPKDTTLGKDTGRDATNVISRPGNNPAEVSPSATRQSANR